jgi:uncharacterized membrane protein (UPF0127 family)
MSGVPSRRVLAAAALILAACAGSSGDASAFGRGSLTIRSSGGGDVQLSVEIADTNQTRAHGLMGRDHLSEGSGMAFTYDGPTMATFWMKDTTIPLSIAFWKGSGRIVDMLDMQPCTSDPCPSYRASTSFVGAVEVSQGFFERHGVGIGDTVELRVISS